ncbi:MAG: diguanylate cyclase [Gammaproteobacteria bacterium]|nr:diguanylate cyclase [Gammaproteobacteria bacterium]
MRTKGYLFSSLILFFAYVAAAAEPSIRFEHLSVEDGLPQSSAKAVLQDRQGFLWVGTQDGLARYDGYSYRVFKRTEGNSASLSANYIRTLYQDRAGYIWVGTDSGLNRFDPKTEQFKRYLADANNPNSISGNNIWAIAEDQKGHIWIGTFAKGLNRFEPETESFLHFSANENNPSALLGNSVRAITADSRGNLWIGTDEGLNRLNDKTTGFTHFRNHPEDNSSLSGTEVNTIFEDRNGIIWVGTHGGLNRFDRIKNQFVRYIANTIDPNTLSDNTVRAIYQDSRGILWVGTNNGFNRFNIETEKFNRYYVDANNPNSLSSNSIYVVTEDHEGFIWVGTYAGGLNYFNPAIEQFNHYRSNSNDPNSLTNNNIFSLALDQKGDLWVGTSGGLNRFDSKMKMLKAYRYDPNDESSLRHNVVLALTEDRRGRLWVGTPGGLSYLDSINEKFVHYLHDPQSRNSLSSNVVSSITEDSQGNFWIGTIGSGLNRFNPDTEIFTHYQFDPDNPNSLSHDRVKTIFEDQRGTIWVGTRGGLNRFDPESQQFKRYRFDQKNSDTISSEVIFSIIEDHNGLLWIGTNNGMIRFDPLNEDYQHFNESDGLPNNVIYTIEQDSQYNLWVSTNNGLSRYNPERNEFTSYYAVHGLQSNEFNGGASFKSSRGELFFGGINGFNRFFPEQLNVEHQKPKVVFTDMLLLNESVPIVPESGSDGINNSGVNNSGVNNSGVNNSGVNTSDKKPKGIKASANNQSEASVAIGRQKAKSGYTLEQAISFTQELTLTHRENLVAFEFSSLHFSNPNESQYAYMLEGFDSDWIMAGHKNRRATYTNLPRGDFILRVKASNYDGVWSEQPSSIRVTVLPPPWLSWWAYTIYSVVLVGSISAYIIRHRKKLIAERQFLEAQIQKRTKAIRTLADIAKDISSTLTIEQLITQLHNHLAKSLDLTVLALGVLEQESNRIRFESALENGQTMPLFYRDIDPKNDLAGWCVVIGEEILLRQYSDRFAFLSQSNEPVVGGKMQSVIYLPIRSRSNKMLGCLTIQSVKVDMFSDDDVDFIRTITNYAGIALDNIISHEELKRMSSTDYLTNLPNRRSFLESSQYLISVAKRSNTAISVAMADIDHFKQFNDQYGHDCGDFVLQKVASLFRMLLREQDIVARWGGEEFIFMLPNTAIEGGVIVLEKLRKKLEEQEFDYDGKQLSISATFGISFLSPAIDLETVIDQADLALYDGKNAGRNCVQVYRASSKSSV